MEEADAAAKAARPHFGSRRVLTVDGQRLAVFEDGAGEACLLLHGYPQDHWCWHHVAADLTRDHRVIAPDWFGCGESERVLSDTARYEVEVERIRLLLDTLGLARVNLICHDYGGFLGLGFAQGYRDRLLRLAIINSRAQGTFAPGPYVLFNAFVLAARLPFGERLYEASPLYAMHRLFLRRYVRNGSFSEAELERYIGFLRTRAGRRWLGRFYRHFQATRRRQLREGCAVLDLPVAVIWGDRDPYSPISIGEELARLLPRAEMTRIEGADHYVAEERPAPVIAALRRLLSVPV